MRMLISMTSSFALTRGSDPITFGTAFPDSFYLVSFLP